MSKKVRYTFTVYADVPFDEEDGSASSKDIEKQIIRLLRQCEAECDIELMATQEVEE